MSGQRLSSKIPYGYLKGEDGKLVPDEETAPVVQMIFQLCAEGNGTGKIARILRERKINTPSTMKFLRTGKSEHYDPDDPCGWNATTVSGILGHKKYLGHTVNFKTTKKSFKSHQVIHNPEEKQVVFENTHEALISPEIWEVVRRNRQHHHWPTKSDKIALFSGLLFCSDCGSRLAAYQVKYREITTKKYTCSKYRNGRGTHPCTIHYIREDVLEKLVLDNLRKVISYARDYEDEFVRQVTDKTMAEQMKGQTAAKRRLAQQTRRIDELDAIIQRLYEDMVTGALTSERFAKLSAAYEKEQKNLEASTAELREKVEACKQQKVNVKSFLKLVKSYTEPEQLTPEILHMFVEKIIVHNSDWSSGHRVQQIDVHYNFVGQLDMSVETTRMRRRSEEELMGQNTSNQ